MSDTIRWGILGAGGIAREFTRDLLATGISVTAVGARTLEGAQKFADELGIARVHGSYQELVDDPEVDVIYVATTHNFHAEHAILALNAGKHVLVEKPFTLNEEEAKTIADVAEARGLIALEAMWTRFLPHIVALRAFIASGAIGQIRTVIADHNQHLPQNPEFRLQNPDLGGGALLDLGIYPVSFAWDMLGAPKEIVAKSSWTATGVDQQTAIIFSYEGGHQAVLHTALDTAGPNTASVIGTNGWIAVDSVFYQATGYTAYNSEGEVIEVFDGRVATRGMEFQALEVERLIRAGETVSEILPTRQSVAIMGSLDEIRRQIGLVYPGGK